MLKKVCLLALVVGLTCGCTYKVALKENYFSGTCDTKLPLKVALVKPTISTLHTTRVVTGAGPCEIEVEADEALQNSVSSMLACHFARVTLVDSSSDAAKDDDLVVYCTCSCPWWIADQGDRFHLKTKGHAYLELTFRVIKESYKVIASYTSQVDWVHYLPAGYITSEAIEVCTFSLATPITAPIGCHSAGKAWEETVMHTISDNVSDLNKQLSEGLANDPIWTQQKQKE